MTDISKEAVERDCKSMRALSYHISSCSQADKVDAENVARVADVMEALSARVEELEAENEKQAEYLLCLGVPKIGPKSGPSGLNDGGFRLIGSDAAVAHFKILYQNKRLQGLDEALKVTTPSTSWGTERLPQKWAEAIEALKEQAND